jgi:hypothetical protein
MGDALGLRRRFVELAPRHANGTLSAADWAWVEGYVRSHREARAELESHRALRQTIRTDVPAVSPEAGLERLLHRVRCQRRFLEPPAPVARLTGSNERTTPLEALP